MADSPEKLQAVGGYIRVSRIGGRAGEGYISPAEQRDAIAGYANQLGAHVPDDAWFEDQDYSGGNLDRPGWEALVQRIESGELGGVIVLRTDRFARNVPDGATQIRHIVDECKAIFGSAQEQMDPRTPTGRYMLQLFLNNAELQLNVLKSGWRSAKERAIKRGAHIGPTPLGYLRHPKGSERSGCLTPDPAWRRIIPRLFDRAARTRDGHKTLANWANQELSRPDGKRWTSTTIGHVLANRVHLGEVAYRPRNDDFAPLVNREAHEALVDAATWSAAQRRPDPKRTTSDRVYLLSGLVRCAACRYRMSPSRGGKNVRVYRCIGEHGAGRCPEPAVVTCERLEDFVLATVQAEWSPRFTLAASSAPAAEELDEAAQRLRAAQDELASFAQDLTARQLLGDEYHPAMEARRRAVDDAQDAYDGLESASDALPVERITWESLERAEVREVLAAAIDAVFVRRGRLPIAERACIVWAGELDDDLPGRGRTITPGIRPFPWPDAN